ncbi:tRNA (guanosine(46)-N7)-methyltransferase TrmB [Flavobacteriales bacterium]|nr:tRNA (guanosine(46)-N7)-methyltransferase TrmB [Flavobacteriales bacterium]
MAKNKLMKFDEMKTMERVFEPSMDEFMDVDYPLQGNWNKDVFKNDNPIVLELGCGKGEYSVGLGRKYPNKNFVGIDIKGARVWKGAKEANEENLTNVAFLRNVVDFVEHFFAENEVDEIWLTFSDPQPKKPNKRLSSREFVKRYKKVLKPNGIIHLKTDNTLLYHSTLEEIEEYGYEVLVNSNNIYEKDWDSFDKETQEILNIRTHYETLFANKGFKIKYVAFRVDD